MARGALDRLQQAKKRPDVLTRKALAEGCVDELRALPPDKRVAAAKTAGFPSSWQKLEAQAAPLLRFIVEDEPLRWHFGTAAVTAWLDIDRPACVAAALPYAATLRPATLFLVLVGVDATECYDVLAPIIRNNAGMRGAIAKQQLQRRMFSDERFVALALELLVDDVACGCALLRAHGGARAADECRGLLERSAVVSEAEGAVLEALEHLLPGPERIPVVAAYVERVVAKHAPGAPIVVDPVQWQIARHARELEVALANDARALAFVHTCVIATRVQRMAVPAG